MKSAVLSIVPLLAGATAASAGCKAALPAGLTPGSSTHNITLSSKSVIGKTTNREYILHLPASYAASNNAPAPLVLAFHGQQQPAWSMEKISEFSNPAFNNNTIVAYPEGLNVQDPGVQWLGDPLAPNSTVIDDRIFVAELLDHLSATLCIDTKRVYAAGLSNGGGLTGLLMCDAQLNGRFAALATVAGAFYPDASLTEPLFQADCQPGLNGRVLPYLNLHGDADAVVAYNGTNSPPPASIPVPEWVEGWAARDGCDKPVVSAVEGGTVEESRWTCKGKQQAVVSRKIHGFGHGWPSKKNQGEPFETLRGGPTTWDATSLLLQWFGRWTL